MESSACRNLDLVVRNLPKADLQGVIDRIVCLPTMPQLARQIAVMVDDPKSSASQVGDAVKRDPATAARILRLVNSAYYGLATSVKTVNQAVGLLGFKVIRSIAVSTSLPTAFKGLVNCGAFSQERFWKHSLLTACLCKSIAKKCRGIDPEAAFDLGLLHDIGKLVLACYAAEHTAAIIGLAHSQQLSYDRVEKELLSTTHSEVGAWLAGKWKFPESLVNEIREHHLSTGCESDHLTAVLQFANCLCKAKGYRCSGSYEKVTISPALSLWLNQRKWNIADFFSVVDQEVQNSKALLAGIQG